MASCSLVYQITDSDLKLPPNGENYMKTNLLSNFLLEYYSSLLNNIVREGK